MQGFIAESFYGAYVKNRSERCKYYKYKYVINWVYEACLENVIVGLFFNQSVVVVKIRQFRVGLRGVRVCEGSFLANVPGLDSTNKSSPITLRLGKT